MDKRMMEWMIRQKEMKNRQIKWAEVDGIINKKILQNISTRGRYSDKFPLPSALRITLQWDGLHAYMNMIRVVNN